MSAALVRRSVSESGCAGWLSGAGAGRLDCAGAKTARRARSRAAIAVSRERSDPISWGSIIGGNSAPYPSRGAHGCPEGPAFALGDLLEYTCPPFFGAPTALGPRVT